MNSGRMVGPLNRGTLLVRLSGTPSGSVVSGNRVKQMLDVADPLGVLEEDWRRCADGRQHTGRGAPAIGTDSSVLWYQYRGAVSHVDGE